MTILRFMLEKISTEHEAGKPGKNTNFAKVPETFRRFQPPI